MIVSYSNITAITRSTLKKLGIIICYEASSSDG